MQHETFKQLDIRKFVTIPQAVSQVATGGFRATMLISSGYNTASGKSGCNQYTTRGTTGYNRVTIPQAVSQVATQDKASIIALLVVTIPQAVSQVATLVSAVRTCDL